jgi:hypothetical protein
VGGEPLGLGSREDLVDEGVQRTRQARVDGVDVEVPVDRAADLAASFLVEHLSQEFFDALSLGKPLATRATAGLSLEGLRP